MSGRNWSGAFAAFFVLAGALQAQRLDLSWPTPSAAFFEGKSWQSFVQPTASGVAESGLFGCTRSGGAQFHEGLDLRPEKRNRQGEATDAILAVLPGVVRHISRTPGNSSYGRYLVLEHPEQTPGVYTLYAHLASFAPGLKVGDRVERGQAVATMGRSASGYAIPKDRAHLHFEIGVWLTRDFQSWYNFKKFGSRNEHGHWNGMNLAGIDPLDFFTQWRAGRVNNFQDYFAQLTPAVKVRVSTRRMPDFPERYPGLVTKPASEVGLIAGWEVTFNEFGLPFAWTPLSAMELLGYREGEVRIVAHDEAALKRCRCKSLVVMRRGRATVGRELETALQLLFGLRAEL